MSASERVVAKNAFLAGRDKSDVVIEFEKGSSDSIASFLHVDVSNPVVHNGSLQWGSSFICYSSDGSVSSGARFCSVSDTKTPDLHQLDIELIDASITPSHVAIAFVELQPGDDPSWRAARLPWSLLAVAPGGPTTELFAPEADAPGNPALVAASRRAVVEASPADHVLCPMPPSSSVRNVRHLRLQVFRERPEVYLERFALFGTTRVYEQRDEPEEF
eukprot:TRINITY_DN9026_c0_g1_i1.p1 TRINITY_DN9026_c0_g1~~TRINITY_DN9026_c0_g1_i1.p1  ORF type:complete len:218 (-),score=32.01 TRINITY_DN9026_c0_g1_i1:149-802(-)